MCPVCRGTMAGCETIDPAGTWKHRSASGNGVLGSGRGGHHGEAKSTNPALLAGVRDEAMSRHPKRQHPRRSQPASPKQHVLTDTVLPGLQVQLCRLWQPRDLDGRAAEVVVRSCQGADLFGCETMPSLPRGSETGTWRNPPSLTWPAEGRRWQVNYSDVGLHPVLRILVTLRDQFVDDTRAVAMTPRIDAEAVK